MDITIFLIQQGQILIELIPFDWWFFLDGFERKLKWRNVPTAVRKQLLGEIVPGQKRPPTGPSVLICKP